MKLLTTPQIVPGAANGYILTSDAAGNATWQPAGAGSATWAGQNVVLTGATLTVPAGYSAVSVGQMDVQGTGSYIVLGNAAVI